MRKTVFVVLIVFFALNSYAYKYGDLYIVKPHDTLWDISKKFYKDPFLWGKIWHNNVYINDPNLIFPGEILRITEHGLEIFSKSKQKTIKKIGQKKYIAPIWFDGYKFYSICNYHTCLWHKDQFRIGYISWDSYSHVEVSKGDVVYIHTHLNNLPEVVYVYRNLKDRLDTSMCNDLDEVYVVVAELKVLKPIRKGIFKAKVIKSIGSITHDDVISSVYPYIVLKGKLEEAKAGKIPLRQMFSYQSEFQSGLGFFFFFKAQKPISNILLKKVEIDRINKGAYEPIKVAEGVVVSQYKNYFAIFVNSIGGIDEVPDRTQQYILR